MHSELIGLHYLTVAREHMKHKSRRADETERTKQFISDKGGEASICVLCIQQGIGYVSGEARGSVSGMLLWKLLSQSSEAAAASR